MELKVVTLGGRKKLTRNIVKDFVDTLDKEQCRLVIKEGTEEIEEFTFKGLKGIVEVALPQSLKQVGIEAFAQCPLLKKLECDADELVLLQGAFKGCNGLEKLDILCKNIMANAFAECGNLQSINIKHGCKEVGRLAFSNCSSLQEVELPSTLTLLSPEALTGCTFLKTVKSVGVTIDWTEANAFDEFEKLVTTAAARRESTSHGFDPDTILDRAKPEQEAKAIKNVVFRGDSAGILDSAGVSATLRAAGIEDEDEFTAELDGTVKYIGRYAFSGMTNLVELEVSPKLSRIGDYAFASCTNLRGLDMTGCKAEVVGTGAFSGCSSLKKLVLGSKIIGARAFSDCTALEEVVLFEDVKQIQLNAFMCCTSLKVVDLPEGLSYLGDPAFKGCTSLTEINWRDIHLECDSSSLQSELTMLSDKVKEGKDTVFADLPEKALCPLCKKPLLRTGACSNIFCAYTGK